jgi:hypothetical protein
MVDIENIKQKYAMDASNEDKATPAVKAVKAELQKMLKTINQFEREAAKKGKLTVSHAIDLVAMARRLGVQI